MLYIKQYKICKIKYLFYPVVQKITRSINRSMNFFFFAKLKKLKDKLRLKQRLAAGNCKSSGLNKTSDFRNFVHGFFWCKHIFFVFQIPGIHIMTIQTPQRTSLQKKHESYSGSVFSPKGFKRVNITFHFLQLPILIKIYLLLFCLLRQAAGLLLILQNLLHILKLL